MWHQLSLRGLQELKATCFRTIPAATAARILQQRSLGVARLRLLPKRNGMRPIAKLGSASLVKFRATPVAAAATAAKRAAHSLRGRPVTEDTAVLDSSAHPKAAEHVEQPEQQQQDHQKLGAGTTAAFHGRWAGRGRQRRSGLKLAAAAEAGRAVGAKWPAPAAVAAAGARRRNGVVLSFRPVNMVLQSAFQVRKHNASATARNMLQLT